MTDVLRHQSVLLREAVDALALRPDGVYVDATFGRGGHSRAILAGLGGSGRLVAFDRDPAAVAAAAQIDDSRFTIHHAPFSAMGELLDRDGLSAVDGILFDLGVSSPQLDDGGRGFSFRFDGPLDMRMDTTAGMTAADWVNGADEAELADVIFGYGEEKFSRRIARAIVAARAEAPIETTARLAQVVAAAMPRHEPGQHPATRTFQAIRIFVNRELDEIERALPQAVGRLAPGGRLAVISFHSLEDRLVKRFLRGQAKPDDLPARLPVRAAELAPARVRLLSRGVRAGAAELAENPRARSAVMRVAERTAQP